MTTPQSVVDKVYTTEQRVNTLMTKGVSQLAVPAAAPAVAANGSFNMGNTTFDDSSTTDAWQTGGRTAYNTLRDNYSDMVNAYNQLRNDFSNLVVSYNNLRSALITSGIIA